MKHVAVIAVLVAGCVESSGHSTVRVEISGAGHGWVKSMSTDAVCTESCELPVVWQPEGWTTVRVGTAERIASTNIELDNLHQAMVLASTDRLAVELEKDANAELMVFPQTDIAALALTANGEVVVTAEDGLHQIGADGVPQWSTATEAPGLLAVSASGQILTGARVSAFHADGSPAWQGSLVGTALAALPDGGAVALVGTTVHALAASDGRPLWSVDVPGATTLATSSSGTIAVAAGTKIARLSATGTPLADLDVPTPIIELAYDPDGMLIAESVGPAPAGEPQGTQLVRMFVFTPNGLIANDTSHTAFALQHLAAMAGRSFTWSQDITYFGLAPLSPYPLGSRLEARAYTGGVTWSLEKPITGNPLPHEMTPVDRAIPRLVACNRTRCAAAGVHEGAPSEQSRWLEVVAPE